MDECLLFRMIKSYQLNFIFFVILNKTAHFTILSTPFYSFTTTFCTYKSLFFAYTLKGCSSFHKPISVLKSKLA